MEAKIIKVTDKGQISIPMSMQKTTGIHKGDSIIMIESKNAIIIKKVNESEFQDLIKHSEKTAAKLWSSKHDDIWDKI